MGHRSPDVPLSPQEVVGRAIQDLTAARLGRGFVPLVVLLVVGVVELVTRGPSDAGALALTLGVPVTAGSMLAYGVRITRRAFGRVTRPWMRAAMLGSLVPPAFALYVIGWRGLRNLTADGGWLGLVTAAGFTLLGGWLMRNWMRVVEVEKLAEAMQPGAESGGVR